MSANFTPVFGGYREPGAFRFWCQKVLPLVYDDSLSYYELLCKVVDYINNLIHDNSETIENMDALLTAYNQLQDYVNTYFANLDLTGEVSNKIEEMADDGELLAIIQPTLDAMGQYLVDQSEVQQTYNEETRADVTASIASQTAYNTQTRTQVGNSINEQNAYNERTREIAQAMVGHPFTANTSSAMTDQTKVYVYTGTTSGSFVNGHWYYYNNGWVDGGVYNSQGLSTDKSLTLEDNAADARYTGLRIGAITDALQWRDGIAASTQDGTERSDNGHVSTTKFTLVNPLSLVGVDRIGFYTDGVISYGTGYLHLYELNSTVYIGFCYILNGSFSYQSANTSYPTLPDMAMSAIVDIIKSDWNSVYQDSWTNAIRLVKVQTDKSLTAMNVPADSGVVGREITAINMDINEFGLEHLNLYSGVGNTLERYVNKDTGVLTFSALFQTSDYIDVSRYTGSTLNVSYSFSGAFYDSTKTFISGSGFGRSDAAYSDITVNVPSNAKYVRVSVNNSDTALLQIGANVSRWNYEPYEEYVLDGLNVTSDQIVGVPAFQTGNLFVLESITANKYIAGNNGQLYTLANYNASDFIEIGEGNYFTASGAWNAVVYMADKTYSRQITRRYGNYPLTALLASGEKYVRITVQSANLTKAKVEKNIGASSYANNAPCIDSGNVISDAYKTTTIYVGTGCYFETINSALTAITDNSEKNRYVIFITEGTYNETITTKDYVDLVGESKYTSVINYISPDESGYANQSAIFASTYTTIKNLTVKTTGTKYPLHCDARYNEPYEVKAFNCIFQHDGFSGTEQPAGTAVGIGLYWGQHVVLEQCECVGSGVVGVASVYCHNSQENDASHSRFRSLTVKNCILSNATYGLRLQAIENNQLQANECVYIGNKNTATIPVSLEASSYQSWHVVSIGNEPSYTP